MIVGLTGGIGSGKSTVMQFFKSYNSVAVYIADVEAKKLIHTSKVIQQKIIENFGKEAYSKGVLNRKYIADIVFTNKDKLTILNGIIHPEVKKDFLNFSLKHNNKSYVIYESALLFETQSNATFDKIICVSAPLEVRIARVIQRDGITREAVLRRVSNQINQNKKILQSHYHIENINLKITKNSVDRIHNILTKTLT